MSKDLLFAAALQRSESPNESCSWSGLGFKPCLISDQQLDFHISPECWGLSSLDGAENGLFNARADRRAAEMSCSQQPWNTHTKRNENQITECDKTADVRVAPPHEAFNKVQQQNVSLIRLLKHGQHNSLMIVMSYMNKHDSYQKCRKQVTWCWTGKPAEHGKQP